MLSVWGFVRILYLALVVPSTQWTACGFPFDGHRTPNEEKIAEQSFLKEVLMNIYEVRLKIATKLVDEIFDRQFYIEDILNGIDEKEYKVQIKFTEEEFVENSGNDDDDDRIIVSADGPHHHRHFKFNSPQNRLLNHLKKFLLKTQRKGLSLNETETILDAIFAAPWPDDVNMPNVQTCYANCSGFGGFFMPLPSSTRAYDQDHQLYHSQPHTGVHSSHGDGKPPSGSVDPVEKMWFCAHSCMNMLIG